LHPLEAPGFAWRTEVDDEVFSYLQRKAQPFLKLSHYQPMAPDVHCSKSKKRVKA
jgi:hypothetical protein